ANNMDSLKNKSASTALVSFIEHTVDRRKRQPLQYYLTQAKSLIPLTMTTLALSLGVQDTTAEWFRQKLLDQ
ncbi:hypothetical protein J6590_107279, partial [Homalodisca vitripennis]